MLYRNHIRLSQIFSISSPAFRPNLRHVFVLQTLLRRNSSASPRHHQYSANELHDLNKLLRHAVQTYGGEHRQRALDELEKTPFAPRDWWSETYERSMRKIPFGDQPVVKACISMDVYIFKHRQFNANWTSTTLSDVKQRQWHNFCVSLATHATISVLMAASVWLYGELLQYHSLHLFNCQFQAFFVFCIGTVASVHPLC